MGKPAECKYCGCRDIITNRSDSVTFACRTYWDAHNGGVWVQRDDTCGSHVGDLYRRIRRALTTLKTAERYDTDDADPDTWLGYRGVAQAVDADIVDQVIQILEGESDGQTE